MFLKKLKDWPPNSGLYSLDPIISAVQERTSSYSIQSNASRFDFIKRCLLFTNSAYIPEKVTWLGLDIGLTNNHNNKSCLINSVVCLDID